MITKEAEDRIRFIQGKKNTPLGDREQFTASARSAFKHVLDHLNFQNGEQLLLPAYIGITETEGSGVFDPVRESKVPYAFYPLDNRLSIVKSAFEEMLKSGQFKAVLIIHYFGFAQRDLNWISDTCKRYRITLIEDCAHTRGSRIRGQLLGTFGDISFFSIHKIIATDDGGLLKINNTELAIPDSDLHLSKPSPNTINQFNATDLSVTNHIRRINYQHLLDNISSNEQITVMYPDLNENTIPLNLPILVHNGKREALYFKLEEKGVITCSLYYRLIREISKEKYPLSYQISDSILNLPVHQDTSIKDLNFLIEQLNTALGEL